MAAGLINQAQPACRHILLCSLGASWAVIPEAWGWLSPRTVDLLLNHPERQRLQRIISDERLAAPNELWICTTSGARTRASLVSLLSWWKMLGAPGVLRIWVAQDVDHVASEQECASMRELISRATLHATELAGPEGSVVALLAGGRKTMSADMQAAATLFGARACLHIVGPEPLPDALRSASPEIFSKPLCAEYAAAINPLVVARGMRSDLLDVEREGRQVSAIEFPLYIPENDAVGKWSCPDGMRLSEEIDVRRREGGRLLSNFVGQLAKRETYDNWRALYRLPPKQVEELRVTPLSESHRSWLMALPKADLHRHVGGSLSIEAQRNVATAIWEASDTQTRESALGVSERLRTATACWPMHWPEILKGPLRAQASAAVLLHFTADELERLLYPQDVLRVGLKQSALGFSAYERPGDLSGSALLMHPAALLPYAQALVDQAAQEGLRYLELRGSPNKYRPQNPAAFLHDFEAALVQAGAQTRPTGGAVRGLRIGFIWILDRRQRPSIGAMVRNIAAIRPQFAGFLLGLDLAGDEGTLNPEALAADFEPAFRQCMPITIHAGEGEHADQIWQAAYHLHADRIGHGLSVVEHPELAQRFRDRGIALELCPTSNREVVGFRDPAVPDKGIDFPSYPLRAMMKMGLPITIATDNPGISCTSLADEFIRAARMGGGLSLWEALALIRIGFSHAMLRAAERDALLADLEQAMLDALLT